MHMFKWFCLAVIKPVLIVYIIVHGIPPTIREVASGIVSIVKAVNRIAK